MIDKRLNHGFNQSNQITHLLNEARRLNSENKPKEAIASLNQIIQLNPNEINNPAILRSFALCNQTRRNYNEAVKYFEKLTQRADCKSSDLILFVNCYESIKTKEAYEKAVVILKNPMFSDDFKAQHHLGLCYQNLGKLDLAFPIFKRMTQKWPKEPKGFLYLAHWYENNKEYKVAVDLYNQINDPTIFVEKQLALGFCYGKWNKHEEAIKIFDKLKDNPTALLAKARSYQTLKNYEAARKTYLSIPGWEKNPTIALSYGRCCQEMKAFPEAFQILNTLNNRNDLMLKDKIDVALGLSYCYEEKARIEYTQKGKQLCYEQAIKVLEHALKLFPNNPDSEPFATKLRQIKLALAKAYQGKKEYLEATKLFNELFANKREDYPDVLLGLGYFYKAQEQYAEAIKTFTTFFELKPYSKERVALGQCYLACKNYENAVAQFKLILNEEENNLHASLGLAEYYYKAKSDHESAYSIYQRLLKNQPNKETVTETLFAYADCFDAEGKSDKAISMLQKINNWSQNTFVLIRLARLYQKMGDFDTAINTYNQILQMEPNQANILLSLGLCYQERGNQEKEYYVKAIETFNKVRRLSKTNPVVDEKAQVALAYCYEKKGEYDEAITRFQSLPNNPEAEIGLAYCYEAKSQYDEAIMIFEKYRATRFLDLAICYEKKGDHDAALKIYLEINPEQQTFAAKLSFARCYQAKKEHDLAINLLSALLNEKNKFLVIQAQYALADSYCKTGKYQDALKIYAMIPQDFDQKMALAYCHEEFDSPQEAIGIYLQVGQTNLSVEQLKRLNLNLARCYANNGNNLEAIERYKIFLNYEPDARDQLFALAFCYQEVQLYDESINLFKKMINEHPEDWQATLGLARVYQKIGNDNFVLPLYEKMLMDFKDNQAALEEILMGLARYYQETATKYNERYTQAINTFKQIPDWEKKIKVRLGLSRLYQQMGSYVAAIAEYDEMLRNAPENAEVLLSMGRCYQEMGKFDPKYYQEALIQLNKIPADHKQKKISIACCLREMGKTEEANHQFEAFQNTPEGQLLFATHLERIGEYDRAIDLLKESSDPHALILLANCYKKIGRFDFAIETFKRTTFLSERTKFQMVKCYLGLQDFNSGLEIINNLLHAKNSSTVIDAQFALAILHESMGNYETALDIYLKIPFSFNRELSRAYCYREMGNYEQAILLYQQIGSLSLSPKQYRNYKLAFAICYEKMGRYEQAISLYQELINVTPWKDISILKNIARCYALMGKEKKMLEPFEGMLDSDEIQGSLGRCYQTLGHYQKAISLLVQAPSKYPPFEKLSLARCYQALNKHTEAWNVYKELIEKFLFYVDAHYYHCHYAIEQGKPEAESLINQFQRRFPNDPRYYLLKFQSRKNQYDQTSEKSLLEGMKHFPYFVDFYIALIHYKTEQGLTKEVTRLQHECRRRFPGHPKFHELKDETPISTKETRTLSTEKQTRINLPPVVKKVFHSLKEASGKIYLVGSYIHKLLGKTELNFLDIDMLVMLKENKDFYAKNYYHCPYNSKLYQRRFNEGDRIISVDCFVRQETELHLEYLNRDFTINCLYCDENGWIYDPTGFGEMDLKNRFLRTVIDTREYAEQSFKDDPVRLLRVCRYLACNYNISEHIENAIRTWTNTDKLDRSHLKAVALSHLNKLPMEEGIVYVSYLRKYRLLEPMFGIKDDNYSLKESMQILRQSCSPIFSPMPTFFPQNYSASSKVDTTIMSKKKSTQQVSILKNPATSTKQNEANTKVSTDAINKKQTHEIRPVNSLTKNSPPQGKESTNHNPKLFKPQRPKPSTNPSPELEYKK